MLKQMIFGLLCCASLFGQQPSDTQPQIEKVMSTTVLQQNGANYSAKDVLKNLFENDDSLREILQRDYDYLKLYINSQKFYNHVRWFSNSLVLDAEEIPNVSQQALINEALFWAEERGSQTINPQAALSQGGLEIAVRARLIALQKAAYSTTELRTHFYSSIPEFAGIIKLSWIRLPLFSSETGAALGEDERMARYMVLDKVAQSINAEELSWEDAVKSYCKDPVTSKRQGKVGYIKRDDVKFEETFRRQLFSDLGSKRIDSILLRGPIIGDSWIYLARLESVITKGVVELQLFKDEVQRSLVNRNLYAKLIELTSEVTRSILIPITL
ncbi:MAG: hypothetical protein P8L98_08280 [Planctomycetota bacterium]|jgi:hypothetical protein|nr:hypothetical protein [Planctomycetota bacterium]